MDRKGAWYQYNDLKLGQGKRAAIEFLQANTTCMNEIDSLVRTSIDIQKNKLGGAIEGEDRFIDMGDDELDTSDM